MSTLALSIKCPHSLASAIRNGLRVFSRPEPQSLVEWADENFYLSSESSYTEGRWETLPFQVAPMNAMGHDEITYVNFIKSARVGYSQMLRACTGYYTEHKARNQLFFVPTDGQAEGLMKTFIETLIRDVPVVKSLAPWFGKKHKDNTLTAKRFSNGKILWVLGGASAKNYREKSVDNVYYDELAAFDEDIEKEGSPTFLGDKRIEGSVFPKSIRGSTPKITGRCQISKAASEAECFFRFYLPCPHCDREQYLKWGGKDEEFGFKWQETDASTAYYLCEHCGSPIANNELMSMQKRAIKAGEPGAYRSECGTWTKDGLIYFKGDRIVDAPESTAFHIWTAYSPFTTWTRIVRDFLKAKDDPSKLKTFVNTTLGETWDEDEGASVDPHSIYMRREHYKSEIPVDCCVMTASVDVQDDRLEVLKKVWVSQEESYAITYKRLYGDLSKPDIWEALHRELSKSYRTSNNILIEPKITCIDSGGHYTDEVYQFCRRWGATKYVPIKGYSIPGKPIAAWPRTANSKGVYLVMVGTDTGKEVVAARLNSAEPGPGYLHYPVTDEFDETFFTHLTNEKKRTVYKKGRRVTEWDSHGKRNEPFDLENYNLVAIRLLQQHFGVDLNNLKPPTSTKTTTRHSFL